MAVGVTNKPSALLIVYNAEAGLLAAIMDSAHKLISPSTYACDLCAITYGLTRMNPKWKSWLASQRFETRFYHRSDFRAAYPNVRVALPSVLIDDDNGLRELVSASDLTSIKTVDMLIARIAERLEGADA